MSRHENTWDEVVVEFTPSPDGEKPARFVFVQSYEDLLTSRAEIVRRNAHSKVLKPETALRLHALLTQSTNISTARARFEEFESHTEQQIADLAHEAFCGPDNDATAEDLIYSDNYNDD